MVVLGVGTMLTSGKFEITHCSRQINLDTATLCKTDSIIVLSLGVVLISSEFETVCSNQIKLDTVALGQSKTTAVLTHGMILISRKFVILRRTNLVKFNPPVICTAPPTLVLDFGMILRRCECGRLSDATGIYPGQIGKGDMERLEVGMK
jgi:hypothetical protein